ncbi:putative phage protein (TIGR02218 family) [Rhodovulum imhoffii]|uniref:Putative phage protein (TIGR02218 family) n=1 Tax=Rhodovulum imhoffii TaxID=365340 RepID=A0A2T5BVE8_9RHOB|nr:DUF2163 domain-containing protein [Rhodovulum imhoffii]MBK5934238.1 hypothetical protein [Rhodovulum imhoffii]PTN03515.1 putative phage protein (TIGR02218 family) [Rhodovulum imhoffii]
MSVSQGLQAHLDSGTTTLCRCWAVMRRDGVVLGFTDHDRDLSFEGIHFRADSGLTAGVLSQSTGLSVDNSEALGALAGDAVCEEDILAGRYDGAEVRAWLVNWAQPAQRLKQFRGSIGEVTRSGGAFTAELRGLAEALNQVQGRAYQRPCSAVLGDGRCRFDPCKPGYFSERVVEDVEEGRVFRFRDMRGFSPRWFEAGRLIVLEGAASGLVGVVKNDRFEGEWRVIELWQKLAAAAGNTVRIEAGCDKRAETCRLKFSNIINFQGFPYLPGEDWLMAYPRSGDLNDGGSLQR